MALLKKVDPRWQPAENPDLKVGEVLDVTDYEGLVRAGTAVLVDEAGNEIELPGQMFECPVCFDELEGLLELVNHVTVHAKKKVGVATEEVGDEVEKLKKDVDKELKKQKKKDKTRAKRLAALEKARAAKKKKAKKKKKSKKKTKKKGKKK